MRSNKRRWAEVAGLSLAAGCGQLFVGGCPANAVPAANEARTTELSAYTIGTPSSTGAMGTVTDVFEPVPENTPIPTTAEAPMAIQVTATSICESDYQKLSNFNVVLGPGANAIVTEDSVFLSSGWAFLWGHYPWIQTGRATAGAEGSQLLVNVTVNPDGTTTEWFFHVEGHTWALPGHQLPCLPETWTDDTLFALLTPTGDSPTLVTLDPNSVPQAFRDQAVTKAQAYAAQLGIEAP